MPFVCCWARTTGCSSRPPSWAAAFSSCSPTPSPGTSWRPPSCRSVSSRPCAARRSSSTSCAHATEPTSDAARPEFDGLDDDRGHGQPGRGRGRRDPVRCERPSVAPCRERPRDPARWSAWNGTAPRRGRHSARPVGNCATSASTGYDAALWLRRSGPGGAMTAYRFYVGIDWATEAHRVVVLDADRRSLHDRTVRHEGVALETFAHWLAQDVAAGVASDVAVALEVPRGAVVDTLLASALATDQPAFRRLEPEDPLIVELRELSRLEDDLRQELGRLTNRLREQLHRYFPPLLQLVPAADEPWLWALLERAPTPSAAQHLPRATLRTLLTRHRIRRVDAETVRTLLRTPALAVAPGTVQAARRHLAVLWPRLRLVHQQQAECATLIDGLLERLAESQEHRDVPILRSVVGVGRVVAATMLAEASRLLAARDYHGLRAQAGVAPVTRQSGRRTLVAMRHACNPRLRHAAYHWGQSAARHDPVSRAHYAQLRARGHSHARALRGIVDRLLRVLIAMLTAGTLYDPTRRRVVADAA